MDMIQEATHIAKEVVLRATSAAPRQGEYLTFRLGAEEYGIDILTVQEIRSYETPTRIANTPDFVKGVINLRGVIVPIIDLRLSLGCDEAPFNDFTVVIVLTVRDQTVGVVVDAVSEVVNLAAGDMQPAPQLPSTLPDGVIVGVATVEARTIILVDIVALVSDEQVGILRLRH